MSCRVVWCHVVSSCRHALKVSSWEDVPFSNETALAQAVTQTPVIVAICAGPALDDWHHYAGVCTNGDSGDIDQHTINPACQFLAVNVLCGWVQPVNGSPLTLSTVAITVKCCS